MLAHRTGPSSEIWRLLSCPFSSCLLHNPSVHYFSISRFYLTQYGVRDSVSGWSTMLQAARSWVRFPSRSLDISIGRTIALGSTQPQTEMSTRNLPRGKGRAASA
jgi:hypothetical protein